MTGLYLIKENYLICEMPTSDAPDDKEALVAKILSNFDMWYWVKRYVLFRVHTNLQNSLSIKKSTCHTSTEPPQP